MLDDDWTKTLSCSSVHHSVWPGSVRRMLRASESPPHCSASSCSVDEASGWGWLIRWNWRRLGQKRGRGSVLRAIAGSKLKAAALGSGRANNLMMEVGPRAWRVLIDDPRRKDSREFRAKADRVPAAFPLSVWNKAFVVVKVLGLMFQQQLI